MNVNGNYRATKLWRIYLQFCSQHYALDVGELLSARTKFASRVQYICIRFMHCSVAVAYWQIYPYPSGLLYCRWGNLKALRRASKASSNDSRKSTTWIYQDLWYSRTKTKTKTMRQKTCAYFIGYIVHPAWAFNTLRWRQNVPHFAGDIFKCISFNENVCILIKLSMKFILNDPFDNMSALV